MNQIFGYDLTVPVTEGVTHITIIAELKQWAKKWAFQREVSEEKKYNHYQIRFSLIKKKKMTDLAKVLSKTVLKGHLSPSSTASGEKFSYVMKADTRVEGPWTDEMEDIQECPEDLKEIKELYQWQQEIKDDCCNGEIDRRKINLIYDPIGNIGKSIFIKWMKYNKYAEYIPPFKELEKFMGYCMSMKTSKAYLIDMPKAMDKKNLSGFWSGIETLKNGFIYDWRNKGRARMMTCPKIWVFTNSIPKLEDLSADRWDIMMVDQSNKIVDWCLTVETYILRRRGEQRQQSKPVKVRRLPEGYVGE